MSDSSQPATSHPAPVVSARPAWIDSLLRPILAFRLSYVPVVMVYFAYGALGLIDVTRDLWIKEALTLTPAELAGIGVWLSLPWTIKMVFGELVDSVPIFGSQRTAYVLIGASFTASGMVTLAGAAGGWLAFLDAEQPLRPRRHADRDRHRDPGRGRRRDVDRSGGAHRRRRPSAPRRTTCAPSSAWCRCSAASRSRPASWRSPACPDGWPAFSRARPCFSWASSSR